MFITALEVVIYVFFLSMVYFSANIC